MDLFALYKETEVLARNIEESRRRLEDIRRLWKEGIVTRNDEIRSELQLTNDDLALREAKDNITIVSQQLDIVLGLDETLLLLPDTTLLSAGVTLGSCEAYIQQAYTHFPGLQIARYNTYIYNESVLPAFPGNTRGNTLSRPLTSTMTICCQQLGRCAQPILQPLSYRNKHKNARARQYVSLRRNAERTDDAEIRRQCASAISATRKRSTG